MSNQTVLDLAVGLLVLGGLVFRQLQARPIRGSQRMAVLAVLFVLGLFETWATCHHFSRSEARPGGCVDADYEQLASPAAARPGQASAQDAAPRGKAQRVPSWAWDATNLHALAIG